MGVFILSSLLRLDLMSKIWSLGARNNKFKQGLGKEEKKAYEIQAFNFLLFGEMNVAGREVRSSATESDFWK